MYYEKAGQQGDDVCQANAGHFYREGRGCEQSFERSAEWYEKAAVQGNAQAMAGLGGLYVMGCGVPQNIERGVEWLKRGALQGNMNAQYLLAVYYEDGMGVAKDYLEKFLRGAKEIPETPTEWCRLQPWLSQCCLD